MSRARTLSESRKSPDAIRCPSERTNPKSPIFGFRGSGETLRNSFKVRNSSSSAVRKASAPHQQQHEPCHNSNMASPSHGHNIDPTSEQNKLNVDCPARTRKTSLDPRQQSPSGSAASEKSAKGSKVPQRARSVMEKRAIEHSMLLASQLVGDDNVTTTVYPHQYTEDPTVAWEMLKTKRPVKLVRPMKLDSPIRPDHVRFVCVACTHGNQLDPKMIPHGDVLIVAGDFTSCGLPQEVKAFNENMGHLKHTYKVVIGGNHECTFDPNFLKGAHKDAKEIALKQALQASLHAAKTQNPKSMLTNCIYLEDSEVELFGLRIYGTPWQPTFDNWAFNSPRGQTLLDKWNQIPVGVDVLVTHTPPLGHGDLLKSGGRVGCVELLNSVSKRIRPKYHVFGHIHEGYGCTTDGYTKFINCCICDTQLQGTNDPVLFDVHLPVETKQFFVQMTKKANKKTKAGGIFAKK